MPMRMLFLRSCYSSGQVKRAALLFTKTHLSITAFPPSVEATWQRQSLSPSLSTEAPLIPSLDPCTCTTVTPSLHIQTAELNHFCRRHTSYWTLKTACSMLSDCSSSEQRIHHAFRQICMSGCLPWVPVDVQSPKPWAAHIHTALPGQYLLHADTGSQFIYF